ncbi:putative bifunctional diguanylate cyclase/phosphodiesterase [Novosphingobium kaempferiae]|uniref:putative bifunctional diguanylate cyclase/phosphodiesterase n=1 Tax=Novosphingobium kaempferiae TaxID=2896849 RepID=UPI001E44560A|nr:bifunctional diguanylate cyclase/phosphodiesterase [Novosphingobium kaempferiae]
MQLGGAGTDIMTAGALGIMVLTISGLAIVALAVLRIGERRRANRIVAWFDAMSLGDFSNAAIPAALDVDTRVLQAAEGLRLSIETQMAHLGEAARLDPLTRLLNREFFRRQVSPYMEEAAAGRLHAMLFIDIDGFKQVNDTLGHNLGDRLLQITADRLRLSIRHRADGDIEDESPSSPLIARFGGDEFVLFLPNIRSTLVAQKVAARILRVLAEPFELGTHAASISASIGIALAPEHGRSYGEVLRVADTAMYHAKRSGRNRSAMFDSTLEEEARIEAETEQELRDAVARGEFMLYFQPLYEMATLRICSAEALIRWNHPHKGIVSPIEFIPLAEKTGIINQIGEWLINEAAKQIAQFAQGGCPVMISVNVSPGQLERIEFPAMVRAALQLWKAPPHLLQLEITENVAMRDSELAAQRLRQISDIGVSIAIDDFGTGYSNLYNLIHLPFTRLKMDRSLVKDLASRADARILAQTIITMANSLGLETVAEGIETHTQFELLLGMGCDVGQGFYMCKPVAAELFMPILCNSGRLAHTAGSRTDAA